MVNVSGKNVYIDANTFSGNVNIVNVDLCYKPWVSNSMYNAFNNCINLSKVTNINNNVTNMSETFSSCFNLVDAPIIPNSIANMERTFSSCVNLTGDIYIYSRNIVNAENCFYNTDIIKNVYIPFTYEESNTSTYNAFINAGYKNDGSVNGVYLKDINSNPSYIITYDETEYTCEPIEDYGLDIIDSTKEEVDLANDFIITRG